MKAIFGDLFKLKNEKNIIFEKATIKIKKKINFYEILPIKNEQLYTKNNLVNQAKITNKLNGFMIGSY
jgi:ribosomal protein L21